MVLNMYFHAQVYNTNMNQLLGQINRRNCELYPLNRVDQLYDLNP